MGRELYEIVPGIELRPGDMIRTRPTDDPDGEVGEQVADVYRLRPDLKVFRRVDPADDPRVLRRALEIASSQLLEAMHAMMERKSPKPSVNDVKHYIDNCISRAVGELETEALDAT